MKMPEARSVLLKLTAAALGVAAGLKDSLHTGAFERAYQTRAEAQDYKRAYELGYANPIEDVFYPEVPFRYDPSLFTDKYNLFPGWERELGDINYFNYHRIDPSQNDPWYEMRKDKLKHKRDIASVMCHTMPLYFPDIEGDPKIQEISEIRDPLKRMEAVLTTLGIETVEQYDPRVIESDWMVDSQTYYVGQKLIYYAELFKKAMLLREMYKYFPEELTPDAEEHRTQLYFASLDISDNYLDGYAKEFVDRTCSPYFNLDPKMWPNHPLKESFQYMARGSCYRSTSLVMHTLSILSGKPNESPIFPLEDGLVGIKEVGKLPDGDSRWNIDNITSWFETESSKNGWEEVTGRSFEDYVSMTAEGNYLVSISMSNESLSDPTHLQLMWQNHECKGKFMWGTDIIDPPNGNIFIPVTLEENRDLYGYPTILESDDLVINTPRTLITNGEIVDSETKTLPNYVKIYRHKIC